MATRSVSVTQVEGSVQLITWVGLGLNDVGEPIEIAGKADKCVHFSGTYTGGGSIKLQGTNKASSTVATTDPTLHDINGDEVIATAEGMFQVKENPLYVYPRVTAGGGSTSLECRLVIKG